MNSTPLYDDRCSLSTPRIEEETECEIVTTVVVTRYSLGFVLAFVRLLLFLLPLSFWSFFF